MKYDYATLIGRFQLPHKAHFELMLQGLQIANKLIICVGSSNIRRNLRNPFSVEQRMALIGAGHSEVRRAINDRRIIFVPVEDSYYSDQWWIEHVQRQVKEAIHRQESNFPDDSERVSSIKEHRIALIGCDRDATTYYLKMFPQWKYEHFEQTQMFAATDCRNAYYEFGLDDKSVHNRLTEFTTQGVIEALRFVIPQQVYEDLNRRFLFVKKYREEWGEGPHYTADAVVIKSGHILLIKRGAEPDIGSWAFPGGFINNKEHPHYAAVRECKEETGFDIFELADKDPWKFLKYSNEYKKLFRDDRGDIRTTACLFDLGYGYLPEVKGGDDAAHAVWIPVADLTAQNMFSDHYFIYRDLIRRL